MNRTKIVCTIGPSTINELSLLALKKAGLGVVRLNGSHNDLNWHQLAINQVHSVLPGVPIILDIPGRKIRTQLLKLEPTFSKGDTIIITTDGNYDGTEKVPVNYANLHLDVTKGDLIMADDGTLSFEVLDVRGMDIYCRAKNSGQLKSRKGINVPFVNLNTPKVTTRDERMIEFACEQKVDYIGLSFVESSEHVIQFKNLVSGRGPKIIAKVENQGGIDSVHMIAKVADAIMIDRGDLSVETTLFDIAIKQKQIIQVAKEYGTPVIVATEMLHTMISSLAPTKAEITDISNAVLDGCSATMLSGETAVGAFPVESVEVMEGVIRAAEEFIDSKNNKSCKKNIPDAINEFIPNLCRNTEITKIVVITRSGYAARMVAKHGLSQPILAVSDDNNVVKSFNLYAGTTGIYSEIPFQRESAEHFIDILKMLWESNQINSDDRTLVTGLSYPHKGAKMNTIQVYAIGELAAALGWSMQN